MYKYEVFPNAPITEAVMDINAQLPKEADLKSLCGLYDYIKDRFEKKQEQHYFKAGIKLSREHAPDVLPSASGLRGYLFHSSKEQKVVQSRVNGFTFNKLKPYENWESFCAEGQELWELYCKMVNPIKVVRIALRYINRIEVPLPLHDFSDYLLTNPEIAPGLPQEVSNFVMRLEIPKPDIESIAIITQTMAKPTGSKRLPLILDIDVIRKTEYIENAEKMWKDFESLHSFKNEIFFNSITEKAKELFR